MNTLAPLSAALLRGPSIRAVALAETWVHGLTAQPDQPPKGAMNAAQARESNRLYAVEGGVALIDVCGMLVPESGWIGCAGITGYPDLEDQIGAALADPSVASVALLIKSGGGYCEELWEFCLWLTAQRGGEKPLVAICHTAASAAYAIASCCDRIVVSPFGLVGSIGTVMVHLELSGFLEKHGVTATVVRSPDGKYRGNMLEALDPATLATFQASTDELTRYFANHVASTRGLTVEAVLATNAAVYELGSGTAEALRLGLVDAVMLPEAALADLIEFSTAAQD